MNLVGVSAVTADGSAPRRVNPSGMTNCTANTMPMLYGSSYKGGATIDMVCCLRSTCRTRSPCMVSSETMTRDGLNCGWLTSRTGSASALIRCFARSAAPGS